MDLHIVPVHHLQKNKMKNTKIQRIKRFKIYLSNELDKACFQHDMAHRDFKDLIRRTASDKILHDKAFNSYKNPKYNGYQCGLASMVYKLFDKNTFGGTVKYEKI